MTIEEELSRVIEEEFIGQINNEQNRFNVQTRMLETIGKFYDINICDLATFEDITIDAYNGNVNIEISDDLRDLILNLNDNMLFGLNPTSSRIRKLTRSDELDSEDEEFEGSCSNLPIKMELEIMKKYFGE